MKISKSLLEKFYDKFEIPDIVGPSFDNGIICTSDLVVKKPPITLEIKEELEEVLINNHGSIQYFKFDDSSTSSWQCGTDFYWESNRYDKTGNTKYDALISLLIECRLHKDVTENVQKVFNDKYFKNK